MRSFQVVANEDGSPQQFNALRDDAHASSFLLAQQMLGYFTLSTNPANGKTLTITISGTAIVLTGTTGTPANPGDFKIKGTAALTVAVILAGLQQPQTTTADFIALSGADQQLISYLSFAAPSGGTTLYVMSNNTNLYAPLMSFSASTNATSDSWTSQTMQLYVHAGTVYVNGTRLLWIGGSSPTVSAPSSNPRIDILSIDDTGTLTWTNGTESSSPTTPAYPNNEIPICELYNVVGETQLLDLDYKNGSQGYIYNDVRPTLGTSVNLQAVTLDILPDADGTRNLGSASKQWSNGYFENSVLVNGLNIATARFGGTGADGALSITSGTTTISCSSTAYVEKNYTSISITSTASIAFSSVNTAVGTIVAFLSQGDVSITSSASPVIDLRSMGGGMGTGGNGLSTPTSASGDGAGGGGGGSGSGRGIDGDGATASVSGAGGPGLPIIPIARHVVPGGNGGKGSDSFGSGSTTGGSGGLGAGALYIECAGAYNFANGTINGNGANGTAGSGSGVGSGGGGGGGGANILVLYQSLTADTGTYSVSSGTGGSGGPAGGAGGNGSNGLALRHVNNYFA